MSRVELSESSIGELRRLANGTSWLAPHARALLAVADVEDGDSA